MDFILVGCQNRQHLGSRQGQKLDLVESTVLVARYHDQPRELVYTGRPLTRSPKLLKFGIMLTHKIVPGAIKKLSWENLQQYSLADSMLIEHDALQELDEVHELLDGTKIEKL